MVSLKMVPLPEEFLSVKDWIKKEAVSLYKSGRISLSKASEIIGISVWEMVDLLKTLNVPLQIGKTS